MIRHTVNEFGIGWAGLDPFPFLFYFIQPFRLVDVLFLPRTVVVVLDDDLSKLACRFATHTQIERETEQQQRAAI